MSHRNALTLLFPIELAGVFEADLTLEGAELDDTQERAGALLLEAIADRANETIEDWERVCGLTPAAADTLQKRRDRVVAKLRERGSLHLFYYVAIALTLGYEIVIEELPANATGYEEHGDASIFIWRVTVNDAPVYYFRAGESEAGERLLDWDDDGALEDMFEDIKPAHTMLVWVYL